MHQRPVAGLTGFCSEDELRNDHLDDAFTLVDEGTVVSICDDLETWCDEMGVDIDDVIMAVEE